MASRKQLAAINFPPGERRRFVFPGPAETARRHRSSGASLDRPHSAGSVSELLLGARKRLAQCRTPHLHELSAQRRNAGYVAVQNDNDCADVAVWTSLNVTADGVLGCD